MKDYEAKKNIFPDRKAVNTERKKILKLTILYGVATLALWKALGPASLIVSLPLLLAVVLHAQAKATLILHRSIENHHFFIMRQNQALNSLHSILGSDRPLPVFGQWAIDPDFAQLIMDKIILNQPATILELGSGLSTVIAGLTQKKSVKARSSR